MRLRLFSFLAALFLGILLTAGIVYAEENISFPYVSFPALREQALQGWQESFTVDGARSRRKRRDPVDAGD